MFIKMTPISQRTILFKKAAYAMPRGGEIQLHEMGTLLILFKKKKKPSQVQWASYKNLTQPTLLS